LNPFVVARLELGTPRPLEHVWAELDRLLHEGLAGERGRYRLFGSRRGRYFSMSLGMPVLGGGAPVLRAWLRDVAGPPRFDVTVGARVEFIAFGGFWIVITLGGAIVQLVLQLRAVAAGRATLGDVGAVLPGIGVMVAILALAFWFFRRRATRDAGILLAAFRHAIGAAPAVESPVAVSTPS
jgi:hypothetical protein